MDHAAESCKFNRAELPICVLHRLRAPLHAEDGMLVADLGKGGYPVKQHSAVSSFDPVEDSETSAKLAKLNQLALEEGWGCPHWKRSFPTIRGWFVM